ncbi:MAG TPA: MmgE/PrpD family protein [Ramlibacter sp.]|nr:MmgE/PrpD family protein [Ramlibacter sp.]
MPADTDLCRDIAAHTADTTFEKLPLQAVEGAKKTLLDTVGVTLAAGGMEPAVRGAIDFANESGGRGESSVLGFGGRVPAVMAAFANGAMAHCLDYDDQTPWGQHAASSLVPAALAVAERVAGERGGVSGRDLITALAIGQDLFNRFRRTIDWRKDWNFSTTMGVYGATAACGFLLRLSREQIAHSLGIASMQSCGTAAVLNSVGSDLRAMYAGFPARGAVTAALLAQKGITGVPHLFEAKHGVLDLYFGNRFDRAGFLDGLGTDYTGGLTLYKRWPAVGTAHSHIHATLELVKAHTLAASDIAEIRVFVGDYHRLMSEPLEARRAPATLVDAKFSLPFLVAVAAVRGEMSLNDFTEAGLSNPGVLAAARKIVLVDDRSLDWKLALPAGRVEIVMRDGRRFERVGTHVPGNPEAPMGWADIVRKFVDCASFAPRAIAAEDVAAVHAAVERLETIEDATTIISRLA